MMLRGPWLTWKMHRFEVLFVACVTVVLALSAAIVARHLADLDLARCTIRDQDGEFLIRGCNESWNQFWDVNGSEGKLARVGLVLAGPVAGLVLGVPIVARELELRTTALAWSLKGIRWRWLVARLWPMLVVTIVALALLGVAGSLLYDALRLGRQTGELAEVAARGPALVARGFLAIGIALLTGALVGRTMPAFIVSVLLVGLWAGLGVSLIQSELSKQWAVWERSDDQSRYYSGADAPLPPIANVDSGQFDTTKPGVDGRPGADFDFDELDRQVIAVCGTYPEDDTDPNGDGSPAQLAWAACADPIQRRGNDTSWDKAVPATRYGDYVTVDIVASLVVGSLAMLLAFPVVARRRPS